jgi:energy-coupling factor transporter ATP-binding protein EcfA2
MKYRYLKNLREISAQKCSDLSKLKQTKPSFSSKAAYRDWCGDPSTAHVFYSAVEGRTPSKRVSNDNPPRMIYGVVADYDSAINWASIDDDLSVKFSTNKPTWRSRTQSGFLRLVWEFKEPVPIEPDMFDTFMKHMMVKLRLDKCFAGFDSSSLRASQYFELGEDWVHTNGELDPALVRSVIIKAASEKPPQSCDTSIPISVVAAEVESRFPSRWVGDFDVGARGPLFWVDDGINRDGCQVVEDGIVCYSDRAGKGFMSWRDIFGPQFVQDYEEKKLSGLLDEYWFNGRTFFKVLYESAVAIPKEQLILELRQAGFSPRQKKGQPLSEVDTAVLTISNQNRIAEIAPVVFSKDRVVSYQGNRILNCANINPVQPDSDGGSSQWPFLHKWLGQLFVDSGKRPALDYFYSWLQRFYLAVLEREFVQGQALLLVGPTNKGKSLLSNRVISGLVGGYADASDYLSGQTKFNKDLGRVATWVIDDTTSAASFQDQRKATELIKRAVANPRVEYQAKYADSLSIPWSGRVVMSLNMDINSLAVIPSLDSSNRDKLMALRVKESATSNFPRNSILEKTIEEELPFFAKFLVDWEVPVEIEGDARFGVESFIDSTIAEAAYDNSSRSTVAELVEFFVKRCRDLNEDMTHWRGTLTEFQVAVHEFNNGRNVGQSNNLELVRRGMATLEEAGKNNPNLRQVFSKGKGGGKLWEINLDSSFDIDVMTKTNLVSVKT